MSKAKAIGGVAGISAAAILAMHTLIKPWEGREYVAYEDIGGVLSVCDGHTGPDIKRNHVYSDAECDAILAKDVAKHEAGLDRCLVNRKVPDQTKAAFISWTFNNGVGAACGSTLVRKANAGDLRGACNELSRWVFVNRRVVRGLENRRFRGDATRVSERTMCMSGIDPAYETPMLERIIADFKEKEYGLEQK
ncbi:MAG: lysozyme [Rickettsiales bacterium]|nr:lysozyme [Rickettsiales bacterium]|tara:strand:- start:2543 stop:3121 length:579 start_codon:yes stop_codon:yes gene_type:complete